ncbi:MAG: hypothetical protein ACLSB9_10430 [Hydrogeniiclostridium mannosilyticum]
MEALFKLFLGLAAPPGCFKGLRGYLLSGTVFGAAVESGGLCAGCRAARLRRGAILG